MSYDDWKDAGPVNQRVQKDDEIYDGTTRPAMTEPLWARIKAGGKNQLLGNPDHDYNADAFSAGHGQYFHLMNTLDKGGRDALKLIREAGKRGDEVVQSAERIGGDTNAWTMVAPDAETARVLRAFVSTALEFYPPAKGVLSQKLPKTPADLDLPAFAAAFEAKATPTRWRTRTLEGPGLKVKGQENSPVITPSGEKLDAAKAAQRLAENNQRRNIKSSATAPRDFTGVIAIFADNGLGEAAQAWTGRLPRNLIVAPMGGEISKDLAKIQRRTQMMANKANVDTHKKPVQMSAQVISNVDAVAVFWDGDYRSKGAQIIAEAARAGKISKILDGNGKEMPLFENARICMDGNMSKQEAARSKTIDAFNLSASEPLARFGIDMIRSEKLGTVSDKDIDRLAGIDETINEIAELAKTETGREYLNKEHRVSGQALNLLADDKVMASARDSYIRSVKHMADNDVTLVGPEDYPVTLLASGQKPPYMFLQGPVEVFRDASNITGIVGDGVINADDPASRLAGSRIAPVTSALSTSANIVARVEGATSMDVPVNGPQILILNGGHAHAGLPAHIQDRDAVLESGGVVVSEYPPEELSSFYQVATRSRVGISSRGNENTTMRAASLLGAMSDAVVVTDLDRSRTASPAHSAVEAGLNVPNAPRRPVVVNANDLDTVAGFAGNRALLMQRGATALVKAGFGARETEKHAEAFDGSKVAIDLGRDPKLGIENLNRLLRKEELVLPERKATRTRDEQVI
jgi:hypothetical protein